MLEIDIGGGNREAARGRGTHMEERMEQFITYLGQVRGLSENTVLSYRRDLLHFKNYMEGELGISDFREVTPDCLEDYFCMLEQEKKPSTVSRHMCSVRALYRYLVKMYLVKEDITERLRSPGVQRDMPEVLTVEEAKALVEQPSGAGPRQLRDRAILELMYATGIKVSELVALKVSDVNLRLGFLHCREEGKDRVIPFGNCARSALLQYLDGGRDALLAEDRCEILFVNYSGAAMTRQGVWKLIRRYGELAGIQKEVNPHSLRHAFAVHLIENGADLQSVQEMMGHAGRAATQIYAAARQPENREAYSRNHPRK